MTLYFRVTTVAPRPGKIIERGQNLPHNGIKFVKKRIGKLKFI